MDTRITRDPEKKKYSFWLSLDEESGQEHIHNDFGHAFPATREQLQKLRQQIDEALR